jgi:large repetitive protein
LGSLPLGLNLSGNGVLSGTAIQPGIYTFSVTATDTLGATATQTHTVVVGVIISTMSLENWTVDEAGYDQTLRPLVEQVSILSRKQERCLRV